MIYKYNLYIINLNFTFPSLLLQSVEEISNCVATPYSKKSKEYKIDSQYPLAVRIKGRFIERTVALRRGLTSFVIFYVPRRIVRILLLCSRPGKTRRITFISKKMMHNNCTAREEQGSNINASCLSLLVGRPRIPETFEGGPSI